MFTCWLPSVRVVEFVIWVVMFYMLYCLALVNSVVHIVLIVFVIVWGFSCTVFIALFTVIVGFLRLVLFI